MFYFKRVWPHVPWVLTSFDAVKNIFCRKGWISRRSSQYSNRLKYNILLDMTIPCNILVHQEPEVMMTLV